MVFLEKNETCYCLFSQTTLYALIVFPLYLFDLHRIVRNSVNKKIKFSSLSNDKTNEQIKKNFSNSMKYNFASRAEDLQVFYYCFFALYFKWYVNATNLSFQSFFIFKHIENRHVVFSSFFCFILLLEHVSLVEDVRDLKQFSGVFFKI